MSLPRLVENRLTRLASQFPVVAVLGARQVGKSTLLQRCFGDRAETFVFDPVQDIGNARADPELFLRLHPPPLVLDEVQHAPELLAAVKRAVDRAAGCYGLYLLTGSQQLPVLRSVQETLAGRVALLDLWPMARCELEDRADDSLLALLLAEERPDAMALADAVRQRVPQRSEMPLLSRLFRGGYPGLLPLYDADAPEWFASYLRTYVERDVAVLRAVHDAHGFTRFVRLIAALTAQELNASHLGREIGIAPPTARAWLHALELSFQVVLLPAWSGNAVKRVSGRRKVHMADSGLASALLAVSSPRALGSHPRLGALFESHVVLEWLKLAQSLAARPRFWHWRSAGGAEVDLIIERDGVVHLVEVKLASRPSRRDASGLRAFAAAYPDTRLGTSIVVHGGADLEALDETTLAVPVEWV